MPVLIYSDNLDFSFSLIGNSPLVNTLVLCKKWEYSAMWRYQSPRLILFDLTRPNSQLDKLKTFIESFNESQTMWAIHYSKTPSIQKKLYEMGFDKILSPLNDPEIELAKFLSTS